MHQAPSIHRTPFSVGRCATQSLCPRVANDIGPRLNLLLLLSALLSALTGAVPGVRRAEAPQAVAQAIVKAQAGRAAVAQRTERPSTVVPTLVAVAYGTLRTLPLAPVALWMDRRRE